MCLILNDEYELTDVIPIGKAFPNETIFLLDETDQQVTEAGIAGEICVSSSELALGYYNAPDKTAQVFVQNPLNHRTMNGFTEPVIWQNMMHREILYIFPEKISRSNIWGTELNLVKLKWQRMPWMESPDPAVFMRLKRSACCFFTPGTCEKRQLIKTLRGILPPYMIPNTALRLTEMPMTKNGKIDRNQLRKLYEEGLHARHFKK